MMGAAANCWKRFSNHGTTMLFKEIVHRLVAQLYSLFLAYIRRSPTAQALLRRRSSEDTRRPSKVQIVRKFPQIKDGTLLLNLLDRTRELIVTR